jgi:hypothetical protein
MSIRTTPLPTGGSVTVATGAGIDAIRLLSMRGMLKLEKLGMKHSRGALRPRIAKELGLSPRASHDTYLAAIEKLLDAAKQKVANENAAEDAIEKAQQP